jgi:hypothetical protein
VLAHLLLAVVVHMQEAMAQILDSLMYQLHCGLLAAVVVVVTTLVRVKQVVQVVAVVVVLMLAQGLAHQVKVTMAVLDNLRQVIFLVVVAVLVAQELKMQHHRDRVEMV